MKDSDISGMINNLMIYNFERIGNGCSEFLIRNQVCRELIVYYIAGLKLF